MPRIRTFKPEFFRSPDTAKASPEARILFLAMWSWADDEGIGETNIYGLLGFAFPDSDKLTAEDLQRLLAEVRGSYGVLFYECRGRFFYAVPSWEKHQKTERRAAGKFPKPDDPDSTPDLRFGSSEDLRGNSDDVECGSFPGTGEQGNTGTGEPGNRGKEGGYVSRERHLAAVPNPETPPSPTCPDFGKTNHAVKCGACADARRARGDWDIAQAAARAQAITDCNDCDDDGWRLGPDRLPLDNAIRCDHTPAEAAANA